MKVVPSNARQLRRWRTVCAAGRLLLDGTGGSTGQVGICASVVAGFPAASAASLIIDQSSCDRLRALAWPDQVPCLAPSRSKSSAGCPNLVKSFVAFLAL